METKNFDFNVEKKNSIISSISNLNENNRINIFNSYLDNNSYDYRLIYKHELDEYINLKKFSVCDLFTILKEANENDDYFLIQLSTKKLKSSSYLNGLFSSICSWKDLANWLNDNSEILIQFNFQHQLSDRMSEDFKKICEKLNQINMDNIDYILFDDDTLTENWDELYKNTLKEDKEYQQEND